MLSMDETSQSSPQVPRDNGTSVDMLIVGGGINGAGIARDAVGRGASVLLVEQDDFASHTSSASTKLIHGGLRYLEYYEFRLVREALIERERLLRIAPHIIWPMRFILPYTPQARPAWMLRLGLFLYDHLAGRQMTLPKSKSINFTTNPVGVPLNGACAKGFSYSDGWVQDSRLVVLNAMDAAARGADVRTRTRMLGAKRVNGMWEAVIENTRDGTREIVRARIMVNAGGPWVSEILRERACIQTDKQVRLVKGSHIVVPRMFEGDQAYILQNPDKRIVFAIPYEQKFTLIGTTDVPWTQAPGKVEISAEEIRYLCESVSRYFRKPVTPDDVVWSYAGVRPLYDDASKNASAVTRDYVLDIDAANGQAPLLSIFGGKITTYRRLAEHAIEKLQPFLPVLSASGWTADRVLPGGDLGEGGFEGALARFAQATPFLDANQHWRLVRNYGSRAMEIVGDAKSAADMGESFGGGLTAREIDYLMTHERAETAEDILWRRSRMGLHVTDEDAARLDTYVQKKRAAR